MHVMFIDSQIVKMENLKLVKFKDLLLNLHPDACVHTHTFICMSYIVEIFITQSFASPDEDKLISTSCVMIGFLEGVAFDLSLEAGVGFGEAEKLGEGAAGRGSRCTGELFTAHVESGERASDLHMRHGDVC